MELRRGKGGNDVQVAKDEHHEQPCADRARLGLELLADQAYEDNDGCEGGQGGCKGSARTELCVRSADAVEGAPSQQRRRKLTSNDSQAEDDDIYERADLAEVLGVGRDEPHRACLR